MSNPSGESSSEYNGGSSDDLFERPLVGRVVAWPRVPHIRGQRCRATALPRVGYGLTMTKEGSESSLVVGTA